VKHWRPLHQEWESSDQPFDGMILVRSKNNGGIELLSFPRSKKWVDLSWPWKHLPLPSVWDTARKLHETSPNARYKRHRSNRFIVPRYGTSHDVSVKSNLRLYDPYIHKRLVLYSGISAISSIQTVQIVQIWLSHIIASDYITLIEHNNT